jgi:hypothetical protein
MPRYVPKDMEPIFEELSSANDRATISVWASLLEYSLEECIAARLRGPENETEKSLLFSEQGGIIGTFFEKIWMAYFLKIVGHQPLPVI